MCCASARERRARNRARASEVRCGWRLRFAVTALPRAASPHLHCARTCRLCPIVVVHVYSVLLPCLRVLIFTLAACFSLCVCPEAVSSRVQAASARRAMVTACQNGPGSINWVLLLNHIRQAAVQRIASGDCVCVCVLSLIAWPAGRASSVTASQHTQSDAERHRLHNACTFTFTAHCSACTYSMHPGGGRS